MVNRYAYKSFNLPKKNPELNQGLNAAEAKEIQRYESFVNMALVKRPSVQRAFCCKGLCLIDVLPIFDGIDPLNHFADVSNMVWFCFYLAGAKGIL